MKMLDRSFLMCLYFVRRDKEASHEVFCVHQAQRVPVKKAPSETSAAGVFAVHSLFSQEYR